MVLIIILLSAEIKHLWKFIYAYVNIIFFAFKILFVSKKLIPYIFSFIFWNFPKQKIIIETFFIPGSPVASIVCRAYCSPQWDCFVHQEETINKIKKVYFIPWYL